MYLNKIKNLAENKIYLKKKNYTVIIGLIPQKQQDLQFFGFFF